MAYIDYGNLCIVLAVMTISAGLWHFIWTRYL